MIGAIGEAKGKVKPVPPAPPAKSESVAAKAAKPGSKLDAGLRVKATPEPQPIAGLKPQPKVEHAGGAHES